MPIVEGLKEEAYLFQLTLRDPSATANMRTALQKGAQTREGELRIAALVEEVAMANKDT